MIPVTINKLQSKKRTGTHFGIAAIKAHHGKEKGMIKSDNGKVFIEGNGITLLAELSCVVNSLKSSGIPGDAILHCVRLGLEDIAEDDVPEDDLLVENFVNELMRKVMERRNAQADKGNGDQ